MAEVKWLTNEYLLFSLHYIDRNIYIFLEFPIILQLTLSLLSPPNFLNTIPVLLCSAVFLSSPILFLFKRLEQKGLGTAQV